MLTLPGLALLAAAPRSVEMPALQRWCLALGLSIAFYPVLFYGLRAVFPTVGLGPFKLALLLLGCAIWVGWRERQTWRHWVRFDPLEWAALAVFGMTLFTRLWIIRDHPYPAWADSLHHTLLTQLTAELGRLPDTLEPYMPISLSQYHLGLYALSGSLQGLAHVPAHTAVLWMSQALNGLCGLSVYWVLDRHSGRLGAVTGAALVGLLSYQPAWYVNWGRFTQVAGQAILLMAWLVTWDVLRAKTGWVTERRVTLWRGGVAALLISGMMLLHFRVAVFYVPLALIVWGWEAGGAFKNGYGPRWLALSGVLAISVLFLVSPAFWEALTTYIRLRTATSAVATPTTAQSVSTYFDWTWAAVYGLAGPAWLWWCAGLCAVVGAVGRQKITWISGLWLGALTALGNLYRLQWPLLNIVNFTGVLILFYLPFALLVGAGVQSMLQHRYAHRWNLAPYSVGVLLVLSFMASHVRVTELDAPRYFVTPADVAAMEWISVNTPPQAVFAINTTFWLPRVPHGNDAGYWIPYFTGRKTTTGSLLLEFAPPDYRQTIVERSRAVEALNTDLNQLTTLRTLGVGYLYLGALSNALGTGLSVSSLTQSSQAHIVYQQGGVTILQLSAP